MAGVGFVRDADGVLPGGRQEAFECRSVGLRGPDCCADGLRLRQCVVVQCGSALPEGRAVNFPNAKE